MRIFSFIKRHLFLVSACAIVVIMAVIIMGRASRTTIQTTETGSKKVELVNVAQYRKGNLTVPADGTVESESQADLKSQASAPIASMHVSIGDRVYPGQTILELENADIRAQLAQAEASLELARGQYQTGGVSLESAKRSAVNAVHDSYIKGYNAVVTDIDPLLNNYDGHGARLYSFIGDYRLSNEIQNTRIELSSVLPAWQTISDSLSESSSAEDIQNAIKTSQSNIALVDSLLSNISTALNDSSNYATTEFMALLNKWKAVVTPARATVSGAAQALTAAESALASAASSQGRTAPAQVSIAEAGVNNLKAQLAKTIIRSPISGKIAALPLRQGELASPGALVATVVGEGGMVIKAFASSEDASRIREGAPVTIRGNSAGVVQSFSPSLSADNRKVEIVVRVSDPKNSGLIVGDNVQISITASNTNSSNAASQQGSTYILPIQNVKIIPGSAFVYTVDENSAIKRNDVILGNVEGDFIEVKSGLNDNMNIVTPVYELEEGQTVEVE